MKSQKLFVNSKLLAISSSGGHLTELFHALSKFDLNNIIFVTSKSHTSSSLKGYKHFFLIDPHKSLFKYILNFIHSLFIFVRIHPDVVISTGAGIAISMILISKLFKVKVVFIETGARIYTPSKTGSFVYKYADLFIVQYESLLKYYPNAVVGSLL